LRVAPHPPYPPYSLDIAPFDFFLLSCLGISKTASKESNPGLQMKFFREYEKFWTKSALTLWKRFSGSEWIKRLDRCIAANGKYMEWSKQWSIELFLTALRSGVAHLIRLILWLASFFIDLEVFRVVLERWIPFGFLLRVDFARSALAGNNLHNCSWEADVSSPSGFTVW
jgi:hypothetical protein